MQPVSGTNCAYIVTVVRVPPHERPNCLDALAFWIVDDAVYWCLLVAADPILKDSNNDDVRLERTIGNFY